MHSFNVDSSILDRKKIEIAITTVCHNKKKKHGKITKKYKQAQHILNNLNKYVDEIQEILSQYYEKKRYEQLREKHPELPEKCFPKAFVPAAPRKFKLVCDNGKEREISCVPLFPDQIIHRIIVNASKDVFLKCFYSRSCGSIPGRGTHYGVKYIKKFIKHSVHSSPTKIKNAAQLDVRKCYQHVNHRVLKSMLRKKFRGVLFIWLCYDIIDSHNDAEVGEEARGLPIGYDTSHWFCNFYLTPIDYYIKSQPDITYHVRYMDDMDIFAKSKKRLHITVKGVMAMAKERGMEIKHTRQVFRYDYITKQLDKKGKFKHRGRAVDMLGFKFYRDKIRLRKHSSLKILRTARKINKLSKSRKPIPVKLARSLMSRLGALRHCDSKEFFAKSIKSLVKIKKIKEIIRNESRKYDYAKQAV